MSNHILTYFGLRERGECIRMLFHVAGAEFEDKRISFEEFATIKHNIEECPSGVLPVLTTPNGKKLVQTAAIIRYVANEYKLYSDDNIERGIIDSILDTLKEIHDKTVTIKFGTKEEDKPAACKSLEEKIAKDFKYLEHRAKENGGGDVLVGAKLSVADVYLVDCLDAIDSCLPDNKYLDCYPLVKHVAAKTRDNENLKKYLAARK